MSDWPYTSVELNGVVLLASEWPVKRPASDGTVRLKSQLSGVGLSHLKGYHTNYGYSGYWGCQVSYQGNWYKYRFEDLNVKYKYQYQKEDVLEQLRTELIRRKGQQVSLFIGG